MSATNTSASVPMDVSERTQAITSAAPAGVLLEAHAKPEGEAAATSHVTLLVTPDLAVPQARLPMVDYAARIDELAVQESPKGLIDQGGRAELDDQLIEKGHYNGFISAVSAAFANHYPLALRPQHFWLLILQGVAKHVELNAEEVRTQWVRHEGQKELVVFCDDFVLNRPNDWAGVVSERSDSFAAQIDANVVEGVAAELSPTFGGTTTVERVCEKITVMDVCKSFFSFKCMTMCGFPQVILEGTHDDWAMLRTNAEALISKRCQNKWADDWLVSLLPLLDKVVEEYGKGLRGEPGDEKFWNSMCKRGGTSGSGARTWFNGWFNILFPYILDRPNKFAIPYSPSLEYVQENRNGTTYGMRAPAGVQGPDCADFPAGVAEAPVTWDYLGREIKLTFKAGFVGATQDASTGTVCPAVGWFIAHAKESESVIDGPLHPASKLPRK